MGWQIAVVLGFVGTAFVFAYIASTLNEKEEGWKQLKLLLYIFVILILLFNVGVMKEVVDADTIDVKELIGGFYSIFMPVILFLVGFLFIYLLWILFNPLIEQTRRRR